MTHTATRPAKTPYRRRRQRRTVITLVLVAALLGGALFVSYGYVQGWLGKPDATVKVCPRTTTVTASQVTLNVYNATQKGGLARKTADSLKKRGFKIAAVANDPLEKKVTGTSEVRYGPAGARAAKLVGAQIKGARMVQDRRTSSTLDIVVGDKFHNLAPQPKPKPKSKSKSKGKGKGKGKSASKAKSKSATTHATPAPSATCTIG